MKKNVGLWMLVGIIAGLGLGFFVNDNIYLKINKNMDEFAQVYKEITMNYVDEIDPEKFMHAGIDGMLETLDPYTVFYGDKEGEEIDLITHGEYGGVGISIGTRDGYIIVIAPMDGYSAQKQGIRAGDRIIEIDGQKIFNTNPDSVRSMVRGEPGTEVKMKVEREGEKEPLDFVLVREEIQVNNVTYSGYIGNGIGYIRLERFSRRAGDEVHQALRELKAKGDLRGVILDLRNNPGGLLEAAVDIVSQFNPKGSTIVTTKGRRSDDEKTYVVPDDPIAGDIPLAVLINKNSASASEIVAGAIQDLDRGILIGTRSFGKGLVQTVTQLGYNTSLKITTARYYTPSGRSIQEIDYRHKNSDGVFLVTPDSLRHEFATKHGRQFLDAGGITPDSTIPDAEHSALAQELIQRAMFFMFATHYVSQHPDGSGDFTVDDALLRQFESYVKEKKFDFKDDAEEKFSELKDAVAKENYGDALTPSLDAVGEQLQKERASAFARHADELREELREEIVGRYAGDKGRIKASLESDVQVQAAAKLLASKKVYVALLAPEKKHR
ncbi:MAG TPA: S41 family peptidase [Bacteroidota bacterium]|nr:S41 family peptidase [Bacteroidota bacterium]